VLSSLETLTDILHCPQLLVIHDIYEIHKWRCHGLTREDRLKESENDAPRMEDPGEDLSLEPDLRPAEPDV